MPTSSPLERFEHYIRAAYAVIWCNTLEPHRAEHVLRDDADILTRRWAASALGQLGGVEAAQALIEFAGAEESGQAISGTNSRKATPPGLPIISSGSRSPHCLHSSRLVQSQEE